MGNSKAIGQCNFTFFIVKSTLVLHSSAALACDVSSAGAMHAGLAHCLYVYSRPQWSGDDLAANMSDLPPLVHTVTIHQTGGATCRQVRNTKNSCRIRLLSIRSRNKKAGELLFLSGLCCTQYSTLHSNIIIAQSKI